MTLSSQHLSYLSLSSGPGKVACLAQCAACRLVWIIENDNEGIDGTLDARGVLTSLAVHAARHPLDEMRESGSSVACPECGAKWDPPTRGEEKPRLIGPSER